MPLQRTLSVVSILSLLAISSNARSESKSNRLVARLNRTAINIGIGDDNNGSIELDFDQYDINDDSVISYDEFPALMQDAFGLDNLFNKLDTDGNDYIDYGELIRWFKAIHSNENNGEWHGFDGSLNTNLQSTHRQNVDNQTDAELAANVVIAMYNRKNNNLQLNRDQFYQYRSDAALYALTSDYYGHINAYNFKLFCILADEVNDALNDMHIDVDDSQTVHNLDKLLPATRRRLIVSHSHHNAHQSVLQQIFAAAITAYYDEYGDGYYYDYDYDEMQQPVVAPPASQPGSDTVYLVHTSMLSAAGKYVELLHALRSIFQGATRLTDITNTVTRWEVNNEIDDEPDRSDTLWKKIKTQLLTEFGSTIQGLTAETFPIIFTQRKEGEHQRGQAGGLNMILDLLAEDPNKYKFWFHWEESWFVTPDRPFLQVLRDALKIMNAPQSDGKQIAQLSFTKFSFNKNEYKVNDPDFWKTRRAPIRTVPGSPNVKYYVVRPWMSSATSIADKIAQGKDLGPSDIPKNKDEWLQGVNQYCTRRAMGETVNGEISCNNDELSIKNVYHYRNGKLGTPTFKADDAKHMNCGHVYPMFGLRPFMARVSEILKIRSSADANKLYHFNKLRSKKAIHFEFMYALKFVCFDLKKAITDVEWIHRDHANHRSTYGHAATKDCSSTPPAALTSQTCSPTPPKTPGGPAIQPPPYLAVKCKATSATATCPSTGNGWQGKATPIPKNTYKDDWTIIVNGQENECKWFKPCDPTAWNDYGMTEQWPSFH